MSISYLRLVDVSCGTEFDTSCGSSVYYKQSTTLSTSQVRWFWRRNRTIGDGRLQILVVKQTSGSFFARS